MDKNTIHAKLQATGIHLLFSLLLVLVGFALLLMWYPAWLFWSDGGIQVLWLLVGVDLVLGPALTFVVYNPKKSIRERLLDLSLILIIQLAAFGYGMYQAYDQRSLMLWYDRTANIVASCPAQFYRVSQQPEPHHSDLLKIFQPKTRLSGLERDLQRQVLMKDAAPCVLQSQFEPLLDQDALHTQRHASKLKLLSAAEQAQISATDPLVLFVGRYREVVLVLDEQHQVRAHYYLPKQ